MDEKMRLAELESLVSAINKTQAVVSFDPSGVILSANENYLKVMGYTLQEVVGKPHSMFMPKKIPQDFQAFWNALGRGEPKAGEYKRYGKGGEEVYWMAVYSPIILDGKVVKIIKFALDITKEKVKSIDFECQIEAIRETQVLYC